VLSSASPEPHRISPNPAIGFCIGGLEYVDTHVHIEGPGITAEMMTSRKA